MLARSPHTNPSHLVPACAAALAGALWLCAAPPALAAATGRASANPTDPVEVRPLASDPLTVGDVILPAATAPAPAPTASGAASEQSPDGPIEAVRASRAHSESASLGAAPARRIAGSAGQQATPPREPPPASGWFPRTLLALGAVVGIIFALRFVIVRATRGATGLAAQLGPGGRAPSGVLSVLARYPVARAQSLVLLKVDRRVLLACQTAAGFTTLSEITDPEDVAAILMKAEDEEGSTISRRFRALLSRFDRDPALAPEIVDSRAARDLLPFSERPSLVSAAGAEPAPGDADPRNSVRRRLASLREQPV